MRPGQGVRAGRRHVITFIYSGVEGVTAEVCGGRGTKHHRVDSCTGEGSAQRRKVALSAKTAMEPTGTPVAATCIVDAAGLWHFLDCGRKGVPLARHTLPYHAIRVPLARQHEVGMSGGGADELNPLADQPTRWVQLGCRRCEALGGCLTSYSDTFWSGLNICFFRRSY